MTILKWNQQSAEDGEYSFANHYLRLLSAPIIEFDDNLRKLVKEMRTALDNSKTGIGLAAPQIGVNKRVFIMDTQKFPDLIVINPEIIEATGRMKFDEQCLSFPGLTARKKRKAFVRLKYRDWSNKEHTLIANGIDAVCIQHEIDHLDGILLID